MTDKSKGIVWFLIIAFAITWSSVLGIYLLGGASTSVTNVSSVSPLVGLLSVMGTFGPAIAGFITLKWITREGFKDTGLRFNFRSGWAYYLWAVIAPLAAGALAVLFSRISGAAMTSMSVITPTNSISWIVGSLIWTPILFGEEFGWRGYLQHRLAPNQPLLAAILMGLIWGLWHYANVLTGIVMSANPLALLIYPVYNIAGSTLLGWLRNKSQSVWPACLAHAVGNVIVTGMITNLLPAIPDISVFLFRLIGEGMVVLVLVLTRRVPWREVDVEQAAALPTIGK